MFDTRNQNSGCDYSEQVLEYVYKELDDSQRSAFESHLGGCKACPDEIKGFAAVSGAIGEWKSTTFDVIETPEISVLDSNSTQLPRETAPATLISRVRNIFGVSPLMWQTASALAVIILTAGLIWIFFGSPAVDKQLADGPSESTPGVKNPTEKAPDLAKDESIDSESTLNPIERPDLEKPKLVVNKTSPAPRRVSNSKRKILAKKRNPVKRPSKRNKNKGIAPKVKDQKIQTLPRLTDLAEAEDSEDESLRLTELFAVADSDDR